MEPSNLVSRKREHPNAYVPQLNPIYRRDLFTLLGRKKLETCREMCRKYSNEIGAWSTGKPRYRLYKLSIGKNRLVPGHDKKDGRIYAWRNWSEILKGKQCCDDLLDVSRELIGCSIIRHGNGEVNYVKFTGWVIKEAFSRETRQNCFMFAAPNVLAHQKSAFDLVHFLSHLDDVAFNMIAFEGMEKWYLDPQQLDPQILYTMSKVSPSGKYLLRSDAFKCPHNFRNKGIEMKHNYVEEFNACKQLVLTHIYDTGCWQDPRNMTRLLQAVKFVLGGGLGDAKLIFRLQSPNVHLILKFLRDEVTGLAPSIPAIFIKTDPECGFRKLPEFCGRRPLRLGRHPSNLNVGDSVLVRRYKFINAKEGREFNVDFRRGYCASAYLGHYNEVHITFADALDHYEIPPIYNFKHSTNGC